MTIPIRSKPSLSIAALLAAALLAGCGSSSDSAKAPVSTDKQIAVTFKGVVGADPFSCTTTFAGIGTAATPAGRVLTPRDFRFYVHDVRLVTSAGAEVSVALTEDGVWQHAGVALLDFEDGTGTCLNGTSRTNAHVVGTVPAGSYAGLRFKLGVPFALNHLLADNQPSPLNLSAMFWSWTSGYRFLRVEGATAGAILHLGSAACNLVDAADPRKGSNCTYANRAEVDLAAFDVDTNKVVLDLKDLWDATDLTTNTPGSAGGCMSAPNDPECAPIFAKLGLPFGASAGGTQTLFKKE